MLLHLTQSYAEYSFVTEIHLGYGTSSYGLFRQLSISHQIFKTFGIERYRRIRKLPLVSVLVSSMILIASKDLDSIQIYGWTGSDRYACSCLIGVHQFKM